MPAVCHANRFNIMLHTQQLAMVRAEQARLQQGLRHWQQRRDAVDAQVSAAATPRLLLASCIARGSVQSAAILGGGAEEGPHRAPCCCRGPRTLRCARARGWAY